MKATANDTFIRVKTNKVRYYVFVKEDKDRHVAGVNVSIIGNFLMVFKDVNTPAVNYEAVNVCSKVATIRICKTFN